jgi:hypothetical protein
MREAHRLGELIERIRRPIVVQPDENYREIGIRSHGRGIFHKDTVSGSDLGSKRIFAIEPGDLVFNIVFAWEGAVAVASASEEGRCASHRFPTYRPIARTCDVQFLALLFESRQGRRILELASPGSAGRNRTLNQSTMLSAKVLVPRLAEQLRIVDLVGAADEAHRRAVQGGQRVRRALDGLLDEWVTRYVGSTVLLGDATNMGSGPSWKASDETASPREGSRRVIGIKNTPEGRSLSLADASYVAGLSARTRTLGAQSILMIRTNGNRARIGNVYRVPPEAYGCAFSAFQIGVDVVDERDVDFVYWMLRAPSVQEAISEAASGTTGLGNIAVRWLKELELPWPSETERRSASGLFDACERVITSAAAEVDALARVRAALLDDLLAGNHEIPESYDALLEPA